jgi:hypothetical protein
VLGAAALGLLGALSPVSLDPASLHPVSLDPAGRP